MRLQHLQTLNLYGTQISDQAIEAMQKALPNCRIERDPPVSQTVDWANWGAKTSTN